MTHTNREDGDEMMSPNRFVLRTFKVGVFEVEVGAWNGVGRVFLHGPFGGHCGWKSADPTGAGLARAVAAGTCSPRVLAEWMGDHPRPEDDFLAAVLLRQAAAMVEDRTKAAAA